MLPVMFTDSSFANTRTRTPSSAQSSSTSGVSPISASSDAKQARTRSGIRTTVSIAPR